MVQFVQEDRAAVWCARKRVSGRGCETRTTCVPVPVARPS